ncbi:MAG: L-threonylcarbamoyladenylate synthase [Gammaproteobacteria bacterium]
MEITFGSRVTMHFSLKLSDGLLVESSFDDEPLSFTVGDGTLDRGLEFDDTHVFTLVCRDLSEISTYARISNAYYRLLKALTPGPYTFVFKATKEVPRMLQNPKRKTIGIRIPDNRIALALLEELDAPLSSSTLIMPGDDIPLTDPYDMRHLLEHQVDMIIDGGYCGIDPTTVVNLEEETPRVLREGLGDPSVFEEE